VGSRIARGELRPTSCKKGQFICSMGLEWMGVHIYAPKATMPRKMDCAERLITHIIK
jgi:hypothetical protein